MGKVGKPFTVEQLPLAATVKDVHRSRAAGLRACLTQAITSNGMSLSDIAAETGIDPSQVTRMLNGEAGLRLDFLAALMERDRLGLFITSLASLVGFDATRRTPDLGHENARLRAELAAVRDHIERLLEAP